MLAAAGNDGGKKKKPRDHASLSLSSTRDERKSSLRKKNLTEGGIGSRKPMERDYACDYASLNRGNRGQTHVVVIETYGKNDEREKENGKKEQKGKSAGRGHSSLRRIEWEKLVNT